MSTTARDGHGAEFRGEELARFVRSRREGLDPAKIPGLLASGHRRKLRVTQDDMGRLIGFSAAWYGKLERGEREHYSDDFLDRAAYALRLDEHERTMLFLLATGHPPATAMNERHAPSSDATCLSAGLRKFIDGQTWPAYVSDGAWDVVTYNQAFEDWFPWMPYERNIMRWIFTYPEARQQLLHWERDWGSLMLAQMRFAQVANPKNERLASVIAEILDVNADARRMWRDEQVYVHPDGDRRSLHLPLHDQPITVEIVAMSPMRNPELRAVQLVPC